MREKQKKEKYMRLYHSDAKEEKCDSETVSSVEILFLSKLHVHNIIIIYPLHICCIMWNKRLSESDIEKWDYNKVINSEWRSGSV